MAHALTSGSKRKGGKVKHRGGLGGPGGRGGRRWSMTAKQLGVLPELPSGVLRKGPRALAAEVKQLAERERSGHATPYRTAMSILTSYANRNSKRMLPEQRAKLARAKDELRELFGEHHAGKGVGGPGKLRAKPTARGRRHPRT